MEVVLQLLAGLLNFINTLALIISLYFLLLAVFSLFIKQRPKLHSGERSFAVLIAAHNEARVIQNTIEACFDLNYPKDLFDVYVVADNCTDDTALVARGAGAWVWERTNPEAGGKAYALQWFFDRLFALEKKYRTVVILDADNIIHPEFLTEMNHKLNQGFQVAQGYLDSKNPYDSPISVFNSLEFWITDRMGKLSRDNLGLSSQLGGTGFVVDTDILQQFGWDPDCLAEDLEFTCKLCLHGYKVGWAHRAIVYDEKPLTFKQSWRQRKRWMQGYADVFTKYFVKLFKKALQTGSPVLADCAIYILQPVTLIIMGSSAALGLAGNFKALLETIANPGLSPAGGLSLRMILLTLVYIIQLFMVPIVLSLDGKLNFKSLLAYLFYPLYSITWVPIAILGIIHRKRKVWVHTEHTRAIKIHEIDSKK